MAIDCLPPELLRYILQLVDSPTYSDKEKQTDLTAFSLISRSFRGPAQSLLFSRPTIRNAGRAFLLNRTLEHPDSHDLAATVRAFSFRAQTMQDNADPRITTSIILQTNPESLTLGSRLFSASHGDAVDELRHALLAKDVREFSFGFHHASNVFGRIFEFLIAWTSLRSLSLTYFDLQLTYPGLISPIPPPPTYELTKLSLTEVYIKPLPPLSLSWFLGATTTSLRSLTLHDVTFNAVPSALFPLLPSHLATLAHLSLHNLSWIIPRGDPIPAYYPCRANTILPLCTALRSLSLQDAYYDRLLNQTVADLPLPPTLTDLELGGKRLFWKVGLEHVVETLPAKSPLARVVLVGPTANQTRVPEVVLACQRKGLSIRTKFAP